MPLSNHRRLIRTTGYLADVFPVAGAQNFFGFSPSQKGIEAFGRVPGPGGKGEFEWAAGVVNGEPGGAFEALEDEEPLEELIGNLEEAYRERGNHDFNDMKDVYASLDYEVWLAGSFTFGGYVYRGTTGFLLDPMDSSSFVEDGNSFLRYGARFRWEETRGRWLVWGIRGETVDPRRALPLTDRFSRFTTDLIFLPAANIKLTLGATRSSDSAPGLAPFDTRYRARLIIAF